MTDNKSQGLILKILLISHGIYFFKLGLKSSAYIILAAIILSFIPKFSASLDHAIEKIVKFLGLALFKFILSFFYFFVIFPLSVFTNKKSSQNTSYENIGKTEINFERPW